ncbi:MAG: glycosyltransferase [Phycisphaerae bacterium]|nr:glycosyltransferase [Phycisphaerae bacterium]MDD5380170.1 glycosyltransferase [Phycisphaerae bacterium]
MGTLEDYIPIAKRGVVDDLMLVAEKLKGRSVQMVNSTAVGGGVAEILNRMVPLFNELGINTKWDVIRGGGDFFSVTKKFHNAIHGKQEEITQHDFDIFMDTSEKNIEQVATDSDIVFIHDPQPIGLIDKKADNKWIWRCHIDASKPDRKVWRFLRHFIDRYDSVVFSAPSFAQKLAMRQFLIAPSIDPLSDKNKELPAEMVESVLQKYGIDREKPVITQISRFDRLKDPVGVIEAYLLVKRHIDCQLILAGGTAVDDPESVQVFEEVKEKAQQDSDIHILLLPQDDLEINALQRASTIIIQKSIGEGFGLTVSEALWKGKPVVASAVGGIPLQITHNYSGLLVHSIEGAAFAIKQLLNTPEYAKKLGENGREHIRNNFLLTRHVRDYMLLFLSLYHEDNVVLF